MSEGCKNIDDFPVPWLSMEPYRRADFLLNNQPDCSFVVGSAHKNSETFACHRRVLASSSPVFEAMFNGNFKESTESQGIRIIDVEPCYFKKFIAFIYHGNVDVVKMLPLNALRKLLELAEKYIVEGLVKVCSITLKQNIEKMDVYDMISLFEYGFEITDPELVTRTSEAIIRKFGSEELVKAFNDSKSKNFFEQLNEEVPGSDAQDASLGPFRCSGSLSFAPPSVFSNPRFPFHSNLSTALNQSRRRSSRNLFSGVPLNEHSGFGFGFSVFSGPGTDGQQNVELMPNAHNAGSQALTNNPEPIEKLLQCPKIFEFSVPVFYEFLIVLNDLVSEAKRFHLFETYLKINNLHLDYNSAAKTESGHNCLLEMLLRSINFSKMSPKEFCNGPGKTEFFSYEEKYEMLSSIVNNMK